MQENNTDLAQAHGSMAFFHFLQERPMERFSRFEAYCFMLDKACANYRPRNIEAKWIPAIGPGQFFITKTELAAAWRWHRATVRWFLGKLTEFGHLSIEEHLKGMLCTMHHLIIPVNPSVAVAYNFDAMARYAMYSYGRGSHNARQTATVCGQIERSASFMLDGNLLSPYAQKQLEEVRKTIIHYVVESTLAHYPGKVAVDDELRYNTTIVERRLFELFTEHLGGRWADLLVLMSDHTELAFGALAQGIHVGRTERARIWQSLLLEAGMPCDTIVPVAWEATDKEAPPTGDALSTEASNTTSKDAPPTESIVSPSDSGNSSSDSDGSHMEGGANPDGQAPGDDMESHGSVSALGD